MSPANWLTFVEKKFGKDYLTKEQKNLLLAGGVQDLMDSLPEEIE